jgi:alpha-tubulin suppressor-like RCC1 family protein
MKIIRLVTTVLLYFVSLLFASTQDVWAAGVAQVSAGDSHTVVVKTDGTLWAWGNNDYGRLGDGTTESKSSPVQIGAEKHWQAAAAGGLHTVALKTDGSLWVWGNNNSKQLGTGTTDNESSPVRIGPGTDWHAVAAGESHTVALKTDGSLWAWGGNWYGQLGEGQQTAKTFQYRSA